MEHKKRLIERTTKHFCKKTNTDKNISTKILSEQFGSVALDNLSLKMDKIRLLIGPSLFLGQSRFQSKKKENGRLFNIIVI